MRFQSFAKILLVVFSLSALFGAASMAASKLAIQDLAQYWAAAHLINQNPYSPDLVTAFEKSCGLPTSPPPLITKMPPWALLFVLPLGFLGYYNAFAAWAVLSVVVVMGCTRAVWNLYSPPPSMAPLLLPLLFGPTFVLLILGQWTVLVLLGITLFLITVERRQDWLAGASLLLVLGKPHVPLLYLIVVALWAVRSKRWAIGYSSALALGIASVASFAMNPHIFVQFVQRSTLVVNETVPYPNLGGMLYVVSGHHILALLPQVIGVIWLVFYWRKHRVDWDWKTDGMIVLLVSVASSYYSYPYDEVMVLPALLGAFVGGNRRIFLAGFAAVNLGYAVYIFNVGGKFTYMYLWWTASGWLVTYILSQRFRPVKVAT